MSSGHRSSRYTQHFKKQGVNVEAGQVIGVAGGTGFSPSGDCEVDGHVFAPLRSEVLLRCRRCFREWGGGVERTHQGESMFQRSGLRMASTMQPNDLPISDGRKYAAITVRLP